MKGIVMKASEFAARLIELVGICGDCDIAIQKEGNELEPATAEIQNCQTLPASTGIGWVVRDEDNDTQVIKVY